MQEDNQRKTGKIPKKKIKMRKLMKETLKADPPHLGKL